MIHWYWPTPLSPFPCLSFLSSPMKEETLHDHQEVVSAQPQTVEAAHEAARDEHSLTLFGALRSHRWAVFWSILVSTSIIMEGYDIVLINSLFAQPAFAKRYGYYAGEDAGWQITGAWQSALAASPIIGAVGGAFANGYLTGRFGYIPVLLGSLTSIVAFIFILFFATSEAMLVVGLILCGIPWGVFATSAPAYASEVCPLALRGHLTVYVNLCWALGQLVSAGVLEGFVDRQDEWAYRIPFCDPMGMANSLAGRALVRS